MIDLVTRWRKIFSQPEPIGKEMLADNVQLHSPMMHTSQKGIDLVAMYIEAGSQVYQRRGFDYVRTFQNEREVCMEFEGTVDGVQINGVDIIRWNEQDQIEDFKIIVRPAKGLQKLAEVMTGIIGELQQGAQKPE